MSCKVGQKYEEWVNIILQERKNRGGNDVALRDPGWMKDEQFNVKTCGTHWG